MAALTEERLIMKPRQEIELQDLSANKTITAGDVNTATSLTVGLLDSLDLTAIFTMFLRPFLHRFLEETGKYFMFPFAAGAALVQAGLKWWEVYLNGGKARTVAEASVESVSAMGVTAAVVGILAAPLLFGHITPLLFAAMVGGKTLWNAGSAIYYLAKGIASPENRSENLKTAANLAVVTVAGILATAAVTAVFVLAHAFLAPLGVAAGAIFTCFIAYNGYKKWREVRERNKQARLTENTPLLGDRPDKKPAPAPENKLGQGAKLTQSLSGQRAESPVKRVPTPAPANGSRFVETNVSVAKVGQYGNKPSTPVDVPAPAQQGQRLARSA